MVSVPLTMVIINLEKSWALYDREKRFFFGLKNTTDDHYHSDSRQRSFSEGAEFT
jgi:hypothetical protein